MSSLELMFEIPKEEGCHNYYRYSPDGSHLLLTTRKSLFLWDSQTGQLQRTLREAHRRVESGGDWIVLETDDNQVPLQIFSRSAGVLLADSASLWLNGSEPIRQLEFGQRPLDWKLSTCGEWLVGATQAKFFRIHLPSGEPFQHQRNLPPSLHAPSVHLAVDPDGLVYFGGYEGWYLLDRDGQVLQQSSETAGQASFSPDGQWLVVASGDKTLFVELASGQVKGCWDLPARTIKFSADSRTVGLYPAPLMRRESTASDFYGVTVYEVGAWRELFKVEGGAFDRFWFGGNPTVLMTSWYTKARGEIATQNLRVSDMLGQQRVAFSYSGAGPRLGSQGHVLTMHYAEGKPARVRLYSGHGGQILGEEETFGVGYKDFHPDGGSFFAPGSASTVRGWRVPIVSERS